MLFRSLVSFLTLYEAKEKHRMFDDLCYHVGCGQVYTCHSGRADAALLTQVCDALCAPWLPLLGLTEML